MTATRKVHSTKRRPAASDTTVRRRKGVRTLFLSSSAALPRSVAILPTLAAPGPPCREQAPRSGHADWGLLCEQAGLLALAFREPGGTAEVRRVVSRRGRAGLMSP